MAHSFQDFTLAAPVAAGGTSVHVCALEALDADHLFVYVRPNGLETGENQSAVITGTSGNYTVTVTMAEAQVAGALVRVVRSTPITDAGRLVIFANGAGLDKDALNTAFRQLLFVQQELQDALERTLRAPIIFPPVSFPLINGDGQPLRTTTGEVPVRRGAIGAPLAGEDIATLNDIVLAQTSGGNLPNPAALADNTFLLVSSAAWLTKTLAQTKTILGLGTAASVNTGTGAANVPTVAQADARYCELSENLNDVPVKATARTNLGLGTAAVLAVGTGASQVVQLDGSARLPAVDGRNLVLTNHLVHGRAGGHLDVAGAISVTTSTSLFATNSATWAVDAATLLPLDALTEVVGNGVADLAVNTGTDRFTLKAGNWKLRIEATIYNIHTSTTYAMALALYDITAGTHNESLIPVVDPANGIRVRETTGSQLSAQQFTKSFLKDLAVDTTFELHGAATSTASTNLKVLSMKVIAEKVLD